MSLPRAARTLTAVVYGEPVPKGRPRFSRSGHAYTPSETVTAERAFAWEVKVQTDLDEPITGPVSVSALFVCGRGRKGRRPDLDNFLKLVLDALNAIAWKDDSQIVELRARVIRGGDEPRTELVITEMPV